jgi:hypothetical protein
MSTTEGDEAGSAESRRRVELFTRPSTTETRRQQSSVVQRLRRLEADQVVDEVAHRVWNAELCPRAAADRTPSCDAAIEKYAEFATWADRHGRRLSPFFGERSTYSAITGEGADVIVFPVTCVAVYDGDDLADLAPSRGDDRVYTVDSCLRRLEETAPGLRP